jgi:anti-anti-sigma factor
MHRSRSWSTPPEAPFALTVDRFDPDHASLRAAGELDLAAAGPLADLLHQTVEVAGRRFIRLDLSEVAYMDCSCLGVLVGAHCRLRAIGGQLTLTSVSGAVDRLVRLTHLDQRLQTAEEPTEPAGLGARSPRQLRPAPPYVPVEHTTCSIKHARVLELEPYRVTRNGGPQ